MAHMMNPDRITEAMIRSQTLKRGNYVENILMLEYKSNVWLHLIWNTLTWFYVDFWKMFDLENTYLLTMEKYPCTTDLLLDWFRFNKAKELDPNQ